MEKNVLTGWMFWLIEGNHLPIGLILRYIVYL